MELLWSVLRWHARQFRRYVACDMCYGAGVVHFAGGGTIRCYCGRPCDKCAGSRLVASRCGGYQKCPQCFDAAA